MIRKICQCVEFGIRVGSKLEKTEWQVPVFVSAGFFDIFFVMIHSVNVKIDTSRENENKKSQKNPVNSKTGTCRSVFSNFEPILVFKRHCGNLKIKCKD